MYQKYRDLNNHVVILGDFNSMSIADRSYAETNINTRLDYRIFKNKCNHDMNKANQPDNGMAACTTWDYGVMDNYWEYNSDPLQDTTNEYSERSIYENSQFWGTFPTSSVSLFHDPSNLDHNGLPTTNHSQAEHLARIDYLLASEDLANLTTDARIIHNYTKEDNTIVLIDEMTDHYPLSTTFTATDDLAVDSYNYQQTKLYPNPSKNGILTIDTTAKNLHSAVVYNTIGEKLFEYPIYRNKINISNLEKGYYIIKLNNGYTKGIIKN